jgi:hypothetical protein
MDLSTMAPDANDLTQVFPFPDEDKESFSVELRYLSPRDMEALRESARLRFRRESKGELTPLEEGRALREATAAEMIGQTILGVKDVTYGKLRELLELSAAKVKAAGGPGATVEMGVTGEGRKNLLHLLTRGRVFMDWCLGTAQSLGKFQGAQWEELAKNSSSGRSSNTAATPSSPTPNT